MITAGNNDNRISFNVTGGQRLMLLVCVTLLCMIAGAIGVGIITGAAPTTPRVRVAAVIQDVVMFLVPALVTALMVTRRPADLLGLRRAGIIGIMLAMVTLVSAIPALNMIISINESLPLPEVLGQAEAEAAETIALLMGPGGSAGGLVVSILIVGLLAPLCEELFFRGCLQRLLTTGGMNVHAAIWLTALIFSAAHMQMAGLVPRMLLGAFFGYLLYWSGSIWPAVVAHSLNNTLATVSSWLSAQEGQEAVLETLGSDSYVVAGVSAILCTVMLILCRRYMRQNISQTSCGGK